MKTLILSMQDVVRIYAMTAVYKIEDIFFDTTSRNKGERCHWPGCKSKAKEGKVYCKKHLQS